MRILHVFNYGWPHIDGYTVRSMGLVTAQKKHLNTDVAVAVSPFTPLTTARDLDFATEAWGPDAQIETVAQSAENFSGLAGRERPSLGFAPYTSALFRRRLGRLIERLKPDLVHAHHPHYVGRPALRAARERGVPFVYEIRCFNGDYDLDRPSAALLALYYRARGHYQNFLERRLARQADTVVTISNGLKHRLTEAGMPSERIFVVRNSVNTNLFAPTKVRRQPEKTLRVGYATTFAEMEGLDIFVRSVPPVLKALRDQGRGIHVVLAGTGPDWERIHHLVGELDLRDVVHLPGFVPYGEMPSFYEDLDLFVVPRRPAALAQHTTPLKPLEALAMECPLLVSDLPALRELLAEREGVRFFEPRSQSLSQALLDFAQHPWTTNRSSAADRSWRREVERYADVYAAVLPHASQPVA